MASLQKREPGVIRSSFTDKERHVFLANNDAFGVDGKSQTGEKVDFRLRRSKSLDGSWTVRVEQIKLKGASGDPQDWLLQFSIDGRTAALPYGSYGQSGVETRCDVSSMLREVTIPKGGLVRDVVVRGYRP